MVLGKVQNRDTICVPCHDFPRPYVFSRYSIVARFEPIVTRFFARLTRFQDKVVVPWVVRFNRDTILTVAGTI